MCVLRRSSNAEDEDECRVSGLSMRGLDVASWTRDGGTWAWRWGWEDLENRDWGLKISGVCDVGIDFCTFI